jgi:hypothetical protein
MIEFLAGLVVGLLVGINKDVIKVKLEKFLGL